MQAIKRLWGMLVGQNLGLPILILAFCTALGLALGPSMGRSYAKRRFHGRANVKEAPVVRRARNMNWICAVGGLGVGLIAVLLLVFLGGR